MAGIVSLLKAADVNLSAFCRRCKGVSLATLYRIDKGDPAVAQEKLKEVRRVYESLRSRLTRFDPLPNSGKATA